MSMIYCPECGHEISAAAVACPSCGRPLSARPVIERPAVIAAVPRQESGVPSWIFIPLGIIGAVLLIVFFVVMSRNNDDSNLNVNVSTRRASTDANRADTSSSTTSTTIPSTSTSIPSTSSDTQTVTVPGTQTGVTSSAPTKGSVTIDAKIAGRTGAPQPVKQEKFYLLDKDVESILAEAGLQSIEGQSLLNSFGLSVLYPDRYADFNRDALRAIKSHIKYAGTTDSTGKAELGGVEPDSYYLFAITKSGRGFAVWSSPVSVNAGQNALNLAPQRLTEMEIAPA